MALIRKMHAIDDRGLLDKVAVLSLNNAHAKEGKYVLYARMRMAIGLQRQL